MSQPVRDPQQQPAAGHAPDGMGEVRALPFFHAHRRLALSALLAIGLGAAFRAAGLPYSRAALLAFDVAALVFLLATARAFTRATPQSMRERAQLVDVGRSAVLWSSVAISCLIVMALWMELRSSSGGSGALDMIAAAVSIVLSWLYMNMIFALHYAHGYYSRRSPTHKGLEFPGTPEPDYWDFAYFALVLGMTFQVSDVQIVNRRLRRTALVHSVIAFFFNVFIIAISVNVAAGRV